MICTHRGFKIETRVARSKFYEVEIFNSNGDLWGVIVKAMALTRTAGVVAEAKRLIDVAFARPTVYAQWRNKDQYQRATLR